MLIDLAVVLVLNPLSFATLFNPPTKDYCKKANEIVRALDAEIYCASKNNHLESHCMRNLVLNDLQMGHIDGTGEKLRCEKTTLEAPILIIRTACAIQSSATRATMKLDASQCSSLTNLVSMIILPKI